MMVTSNVLFVLMLSLLIASTKSEIRKFTGILQAESSYIHYSEGYLVTPGYVDIGGLVFSSTTEEDEKILQEELNQLDKEDKQQPHKQEDDSEHEDAKDNDEEKDLDDNSNGSGRRTTMVPPFTVKDLQGNRVLDGSTDHGGSKIDIVLFHEPPSCSDTRAGCDWTELGIGSPGSSDDEGIRWCCNSEAVAYGLCPESGRLILNNTNHHFRQRSVDIPSTGEFALSVLPGKLSEPTGSGKYVLILANCNDEFGRDVAVSGSYEWKSKHGYLPGDLVTEMYFFAVLTALYFVLMLWYGISMKLHEDDGIPIQKWILGSIALGLLESFFRTGDYFAWNEDGTRFWFAMYTGIFVGVLKRALSKCLIVMVSLGWGVVRDTLDQLLHIQILGTLYAVAAIALDIVTDLSVTENKILSDHQEDELMDLGTVLLFIVIAINVTFGLWALDSISATMQYLENMNQNRKLLRYLRLRCYLLFSFLFALIWFVLTVVDSWSEEGVMEQPNKWIIDALMRLNYLSVLICVAILWRPAPNAKEFAYVMELPALGEENELEMTATVPSALDDDDDDDGDEYQEEVDFEGGFKE